jgi:hypothetical protein
MCGLRPHGVNSPAHRQQTLGFPACLWKAVRVIVSSSPPPMTIDMEFHRSQGSLRISSCAYIIRRASLVTLGAHACTPAHGAEERSGAHDKIRLEMGRAVGVNSSLGLEIIQDRLLFAAVVCGKAGKENERGGAPSLTLDREPSNSESRCFALLPGVDCIPRPHAR